MKIFQHYRKNMKKSVKKNLWAKSIIKSIYIRIIGLYSKLIQNSVITRKFAPEKEINIIDGQTLDANVVSEPLGVYCLRDQYLIPNQYASYDDHGFRSDLTSLFRGSSSISVGANDAIQVPKIGSQSFIPKAIYGGVLFDHYGHFVTESMSRIWLNIQPGVASVEHDIPYIFFLHNQESKNHDFSFKSLLSTVLGKRQYLIVDRPVFIRELLVPDVSIKNNCFVNQVHISILRQLSQDIVGECKRLDQKTSSFDDAIYLSRSRLPGDVRLVAGEEELEAALQNAGVKIVHPQELPLSRQISIICNATTVIGMVGSAFHTVMFCPEVKPRLNIFICGSYINKNFLNIDRACSVSSIFLQATFRHPLNLKLRSHDRDEIMNAGSVFDCIEDIRRTWDRVRVY